MFAKAWVKINILEDCLPNKQKNETRKSPILNLIGIQVLLYNPQFHTILTLLDA